jgi:shikimate dehydrogenase
MTLPAPTICGSLSRFPVGLGRAMHQAGYDALGLSYLYVPFACADLAAAVAGLRALGVRGVGISMPFKTEILPLLDELDENARRLGAVNTVVQTDGRLRGYNTDASGAVGALDERGGVRGKRLLLLGAGGAARALAFAFVDEGADVVIANRTDERAEALAREVGAKQRPFASLENAFDFDIYVNASSAGMTDVDPRSPLPRALFGADKIVMDAVYKPIETELVREARDEGATSIDGTRMLLHQAMGQFALYTGVEAPRAAMETALAQALAG